MREAHQEGKKQGNQNAKVVTRWEEEPNDAGVLANLLAPLVPPINGIFITMTLLPSTILSNSPTKTRSSERIVTAKKRKSLNEKLDSWFEPDTQDWPCKVAKSQEELRACSCYSS